ncbi:hypothetical protein PspLS_06396 [Pyricularia sp. CBS 133598]|nr:hypothetical protein PspLS_06396 [Pyricularia sp. CBS 133598]
MTLGIQINSSLAMFVLGFDACTVLKKNLDLLVVAFPNSQVERCAQFEICAFSRAPPLRRIQKISFVAKHESFPVTNNHNCGMWHEHPDT